MSDRKTGRILIVDDSAVMRQKLSIAIRNLGRDPEQVSDGEEALSRMAQGDIDLVLLDLVMPEMDGYAVLAAMKADSTLREIPVLVVSSLEDASDVGHAIELGAIDVLSKSVDRARLSARIETSLERRRLRKVELEYLAASQRLIDAARVVEEADFDPRNLGLDDVATRQDAVGDLARVFTAMAAEVHRRSQFYDRQIVLLRNAVLLLLIAVPYGLMPTLSRVLALTDIHPVGLTAAVTLTSALLLLFVSAVRGRLPKVTPNRVLFALQVGIVGTVLPQIALFIAAQRVEASVITIVIALESALVFVLAMLLRLELPSFRRFAGVLVAGFAILLIVMPNLSQAAAFVDPLWLVPAIVAALLHAGKSVLLVLHADARIDAAETVTLIAVISAAVIVPVAIYTGVFPHPSALNGDTGLTLILLSAVTAGASVAYVYAAQITGAAFASQYAAPLTVTGVLWALVILKESPTVWVWAATACMTFGMLLIRTRASRGGS